MGCQNDILDKTKEAAYVVPAAICRHFNGSSNQSWQKTQEDSVKIQDYFQVCVFSL